MAQDSRATTIHFTLLVDDDPVDLAAIGQRERCVDAEESADGGQGVSVTPVDVSPPVPGLVPMSRAVVSCPAVSIVISRAVKFQHRHPQRT